MTAKRRSNNMFYGGVIFIIVVCSFVYSWKFLVPKYNSQKAEITVVEDELKAATNKLESIKATRLTLETLKPITNQLFIAVPGDKDSPNLVTELEAIALKNKILIPSIQISDSTVTPTTGNSQNVAVASSANSVLISFAVNGSFDNLNALITSIEKDIRFMNVKSLSIASNEEDPGNMSLTIQIEAYKRASAVPVTTTPVSGVAPSTATKTTGAQ